VYPFSVFRMLRFVRTDLVGWTVSLLNYCFLSLWNSSGLRLYVFHRLYKHCSPRILPSLVVVFILFELKTSQGLGYRGRAS
jgi:hypothetical protein